LQGRLWLRLREVERRAKQTVEDKSYDAIFEQFEKVLLAKITIVSDILLAHEVWKILLWR
jgi:hypothetical protein